MGTYLTGTYSVLHTSGVTDFDNFVYSAVYFNSTGTYTINIFEDERLLDSAEFQLK